MAGPRWGIEHRIVKQSGVDVVLALDASLSMMATDEVPSRLSKMKQVVRQLRALSPNDRFALIAFAGRSYILTPMTTDDGAIGLYLDNLDPSIVGQAGSSVSSAIQQATNLLNLNKGGGGRAIVLMSDGEGFDSENDVVDQAKRAADAGDELITVGFGTLQGSTIPIVDRGTKTMKRDENGQVVVTRYTPTLLHAAADAADGVFIDAGVPNKAQQIRAVLDRLQTSPRSAHTGSDFAPQFQWFVAPALLLLLLDIFLGLRHRKRRAPTSEMETSDVSNSAGVSQTSDISKNFDMSQMPNTSNASRASRNTVRGSAVGTPGTTAVVSLLSAGILSISALGLVATLVSCGPARDLPNMRRYNRGTELLAHDSLHDAVPPLDSAIRTTEAALRLRAAFNSGLSYLVSGLRLRDDSTRKSRPSDSLNTVINATLDSALARYRVALITSPNDTDAKWNYELALRKKQGGGGGGGGGNGGGGGGANQAPTPKPRPSGGIGQQQASAILENAEREERDVQGKNQRKNVPQPPPQGKDW
jgi:Ca-activated chloride channel family protein